MNILFTCAGRRNYLINKFKKELGKDGKIIAIDKNYSSALVEADVSIVVPGIYEPDYLPILKAIIRDYEVGALISLNDLELPIIAENKEELQKLGVQVLVSDSTVVNICSDKWKTFKFLKVTKVQTPKTYVSLEKVLQCIEDKELRYPLILKPRWGSGSVGVETVHSEQEMLLTYAYLKFKVKNSILRKISSIDQDRSILFQEKIMGTEYGMDILNDFRGNYHGSFARRKLSMRSGETEKACSVIHEAFSEIGETIGKATGHIGTMDCDLLLADGKLHLLEMNPRFGGGYPFSHEAGINTPAIYLNWLRGIQDVGQHNNYRDNVTFCKSDKMLFVPDKNPENVIHTPDITG